MTVRKLTESIIATHIFVTLSQPTHLKTTPSLPLPPGSPHVVSLKTRLLALQVLGTIMNELSDTSPEATEKCAKVCMYDGRGGGLSRVLVCQDKRVIWDGRIDLSCLSV